MGENSVFSHVARAGICIIFLYYCYYFSASLTGLHHWAFWELFFSNFDWGKWKTEFAFLLKFCFALEQNENITSKICEV